jgi:hypothetical protein
MGLRVSPPTRTAVRFDLPSEGRSCATPNHLPLVGANEVSRVGDHA